MQRTPTANEFRYVRSFLRDRRNVVAAAFLLIAAAIVLLNVIFLWLYFADPRSSAGVAAGLLIADLMFSPIIFMLGRRLVVDRPTPLVERLSGPFERKEFGFGDGSIDVHSVGGTTVLMPRHWLRHLREGEQLEVEVCFVPARGIDKLAYGERAGILISVGERLSVDREVPLGLLSLTAYPFMLVGLVGFIGFLCLVFALVLSDDTARLIRHWRGRDGTIAFEDTCAFVAGHPPDDAHVQIQHANLIHGPLGAEFPDHWLIDADGSDRTAVDDFIARMAPSPKRLRWDATARYEWNRLSQTFWYDLLGRHKPCVVDVSHADTDLSDRTLGGQISRFRAGFLESGRYEGNIRTLHQDGSIVLALDLSDKPVPLPSPAGVYLLAIGSSTTIASAAFLVVRIRRRRKILARLAAATS
jgi:hypothetical protein